MDNVEMLKPQSSSGQLLHDRVSHIYEKVLVPFVPTEVLGEDGQWKSVNSLNITPKQKFIEVKTASHSLLCTSKHILVKEDGDEVLAEDASGVAV